MYLVSIKIFDTNSASRSDKDGCEVIGIDTEPLHQMHEGRKSYNAFSLQKPSAYCFLL